MHSGYWRGITDDGLKQIPVLAEGVQARLERKGDPWANILSEKNDLTALMAASE